MRDPLRNVSVRYKLALTFAVVCLLAFGVGGYAVSRSAMGSLEGEIRTRLEFEAELHAKALDAEMRALAQRARDFASDGYIRTRLEAMQAATTAEELDEARRELGAHLRRNKLPLVPAFTDLIVVDSGGDVLVAATEERPAWLASVLARPPGQELWCSGLYFDPREQEPPAVVLSTPLHSLVGARRIGTLLLELHPGVWVVQAMGEIENLEAEAAPRPSLELIDPRGRRLAIPPGLLEPPLPSVSSDLVLSGVGLRPAAPRPQRHPSWSPIRGSLRSRIPIASNGWEVELELASHGALAAVAGLQTRFLVVGLVLTGLAAALLFFPMRFLARPLVELGEAARRIERGEFTVRVPVASSDEVGALASSFNGMAEAVEERTSRLQRAAADLERGKQELRRERDRLNAVISSMRDGLVVLDAHGRPEVWNAAAAPLIDVVRGDGPAPTSHRICHHALEVDEDTEPAGGEQAGAEDAAGSACRRCLSDPVAPPRSCLIDVASSVYEVRSTRLFHGEDGGAGRVLVSRDVTDRIAQDERQIHQERLAVLGEVASVVAHELNNPLAAITMFNQMLSSELPEDSELREHVSVIERNAQSCKRTIRELLDYATGASPEIGEVDLHATLEDVARFLRPLRERQDVELDLRLAMVEPVVRGDEVQVRQIFVNLVMNALQALEGRGGRILVTTSREQDHAVVSVQDDGPGIPPAVSEQVFKPFFTTKPRGIGTGLGLPTARRISEMQGGSLELVSSAPGRTLFRVRLLIHPS